MTPDAFAGQRILVTGAAGFIGMHAAVALLDAGAEVVGVDNFDPYYDVRLKEARASLLAARPGFTFRRIDLADAAATARLFGDNDFTRVVHLAAQPVVGLRRQSRLALLRGSAGRPSGQPVCRDQEGERANGALL
jgi:nucleoside-diphosphate-sugar epimerase